MTSGKNMNLPDGWLSEGQAAYLAQLVRDVAGLEGSFLEVGSFHGRSATAIGTEVKKLNSRLYCIDIWNKKLTGKDEIERKEIMEEYRKIPIVEHFKGDSYLMFTENIKARGLGDVIVPIIGLSSTIRKTWEIPLRFIFIDGNHDYEYVWEDYLWGQFLVGAGIIAFHDYMGKCGVRKAVNGMMDNNPNFKPMGLIGGIRTFRRL